MSNNFLNFLLIYVESSLLQLYLDNGLNTIKIFSNTTSTGEDDSLFQGIFNINLPSELNFNSNGNSKSVNISYFNATFSITTFPFQIPNCKLV